MNTPSTKPGLGSYMLRYGLMIAALQIVLSLVLYLIDFNPFKPGSSIINLFLTLLISIVVLRAGLIKYRQVNFEGRISYGQLFIAGALILLVSSVVGSLFSYLFYQVYEPDLMMRYAQEMLDSYVGRIPEQQFDMMEERIMKNLEPGRQLMSMLINIPVSSIVISAIVSLFIKKDTTLIPE